MAGDADGRADQPAFGSGKKAFELRSEVSEGTAPAIPSFDGGAFSACSRTNKKMQKKRLRIRKMHIEFRVSGNMDA